MAETKTARRKAGTHPALKGSVFNARLAVEIHAAFKDTVGMTSKVATAVAEAGVNILAGSGYSASAMYRKAIFTFVVDDYSRAETALEGIGAEDIEETSVILVDMPNKVGAFERAARIIADAKINIFFFYATTSTGRTATCVIKTADDKKAISLLNKAK